MKDFLKKDAMCKIKCTMSNKSYTQQTNTFSTKISKNNMDNKKIHQQTKIGKKKLTFQV
jgi:hypothetical protein